MLGWPRKIQDQSENCIKQLDQDEERFQKNLTNDQSAFEDRLDSLEVFIIVCIVYHHYVMINCGFGFFVFWRSTFYFHFQCFICWMEKTFSKVRNCNNNSTMILIT